MKTPLFVLALTATLALGACNPLETGPVGNANVPQPRKAVDLGRYVGPGTSRAATRSTDCP